MPFPAPPACLEHLVFSSRGEQLKGEADRGHELGDQRQGGAECVEAEQLALMGGQPEGSGEER